MIVACSTFLNQLAHWFIVVSVVCLSVMALLGTADVLALNLIDVPIPSATEVIASMMPIAIMMAMSYAQLTRAHVTVDLFRKHFSTGMVRFVESISILAGLIVFLLMAYGAWQLAFNSIEVDERAVAAVRFPIWPIKIVFSFGISVCALQMLFDLLVTLTGQRSGHGQELSSSTDPNPHSDSA